MNTEAATKALQEMKGNLKVEMKDLQKKLRRDPIHGIVHHLPEIARVVCHFAVCTDTMKRLENGSDDVVEYIRNEAMRKTLHAPQNVGATQQTLWVHQLDALHEVLAILEKDRTFS